MNKFVRPLLALALASICGAGAHALEIDTGYGNEAFSKKSAYSRPREPESKRQQTKSIPVQNRTVRFNPPSGTMASSKTHNTAMAAIPSMYS